MHSQSQGIDQRGQEVALGGRYVLSFYGALVFIENYSLFIEACFRIEQHENLY